MKTESLAKLRAKHNAYMFQWKASGRRTLAYTAPCCGATIETTAPPKGETWDSLATCPHCGELHFKVVTFDRATAAQGVQ